MITRIETPMKIQKISDFKKYVVFEKENIFHNNSWDYHFRMQIKTDS